MLEYCKLEMLEYRILILYYLVKRDYILLNMIVLLIVLKIGLF